MLSDVGQRNVIIFVDAEDCDLRLLDFDLCHTY